MFQKIYRIFGHPNFCSKSIMSRSIIPLENLSKIHVWEKIFLQKLILINGIDVSYNFRETFFAIIGNEASNEELFPFDFCSFR